MRSLTNKLKASYGGLMSVCCLAFVGCVAVLLTAGCHKAAHGVLSDAPEKGVATTDPEVVANLGNLTMALHEALHHHSQGFSNFDELVSYAQLQPPPPPSGTKYAISKTCQIVLIQAK
ncbi:MAG: hypothetical protein ACLQU4_01260 [Limisphaerales bacterium]